MKALPPGSSLTGEDLFKSFSVNPFNFLLDCYKEYGDLFTVKLGDFNVKKYGASGDWVFLCNSNHIRTIFKTGSDIINAGQANDIQFQGLMPQESILILDDDAYKVRRKLLTPSIQNKVKIRNLTAEIRQITLDKIADFPRNESFALAPVLRDIAGKVMSHLIFGEFAPEATGCLNEKIEEFGNAVTFDAQAVSISETSLGLRDLITKYKSCPHSVNSSDQRIFDVMINTKNNKNSLTEQDISGEILVLLLGGIDTTGTSMIWCMSWILNNPNDVLTKIKEEITSVLGDRIATSDDYDKLSYLDAVIKESIRISPMLYTTSGRLLLQPLELGEHLLPAGTIVATAPFIVHNREDYYPEPAKFMPERFLNITPDSSKWLHFGGGIRRCLGMDFALYEMKVVIATLLRNLDFRPVDIRNEVEKQGLFYAPVGCVTVKLNDQND